MSDTGPIVTTTESTSAERAAHHAARCIADKALIRNKKGETRGLSRQGKSPYFRLRLALKERILQHLTEFGETRIEYVFIGDSAHPHIRRAARDLNLPDGIRIVWTENFSVWLNEDDEMSHLVLLLDSHFPAVQVIYPVPPV